MIYSICHVGYNVTMVRKFSRINYTLSTFIMVMLYALYKCSTAVASPCHILVTATALGCRVPPFYVYLSRIFLPKPCVNNSYRVNSFRVWALRVQEQRYSPAPIHCSAKKNPFWYVEPPKFFSTNLLSYQHLRSRTNFYSSPMVLFKTLRDELHCILTPCVRYTLASATHPILLGPQKYIIILFYIYTGR